MAPLQSKNELMEENSGKGVKEMNVRPKTKTNDADPTKRNTLSQTFHTQQTVKHRRLVEKVQKPPSADVQKSKPGTYKGRVVQSKIDCFRKPSGDAKTTEKKVVPKPDATRPKSDLPKVRSKSVTSLLTSTKPRVNSLSSRSKSVSDVPLNATEKPVQKSVSHKRMLQKVPGAISKGGPLAVCVPPKPAPLATGCSAVSRPIALKKAAAVQVAKPKPATTQKNVLRPVTSTISQYNVRMETAEERKAKLAEWLASKGKTLKRPPISEKSAVFSQKPAPQPKTRAKATTAAQSKRVIQTEDVKPTPALKNNNQSDDIKVLESKPVNSSDSSNIMNTTLDFLDNSDMDLPVDPEIRMESLVMNLCDKLDAMETPSSCEDGISADKVDVLAEEIEGQVEEHETDKLFEILEDEELEDEEDSKIDITEDAEKGGIKNEDDDQESNEKKPFESGDDSDEEMRSTTPEMEGASIVKYNVKTTPYLQSVKKRIESAPASGSRHKSTIKDIKFLTPVRRSTRIQRKSSRLPGMLNDHDTCVSSLAELVQMDDADSSAYIYRKNLALLEDLPDQPADLAKVCS